MKLYVGLVVGLEETSLCIVDSEGVTVREVKVSTEPEAIRRALEGSADRLDRVGVEASSLGIWLYRELQPAGVPIIVVEARHMRVSLSTMRNKTDRNDARGIAQMMRLGSYRAVHVKNIDMQKMRPLLANRKLLKRKLIDVENHIRGTLRAYGLLMGAVGRGGYEARVREFLEHSDPIFSSWSCASGCAGPLDPVAATHAAAARGADRRAEPAAAAAAQPVAGQREATLRSGGQISEVAPRERGDTGRWWSGHGAGLRANGTISRVRDWLVDRGTTEEPRDDDLHARYRVWKDEHGDVQMFPRRPRTMSLGDVVIHRPVGSNGNPLIAVGEVCSMPETSGHDRGPWQVRLLLLVYACRHVTDGAGAIART